jgi:hypothetical protein
MSTPLYETFGKDERINFHRSVLNILRQNPDRQFNDAELINWKQNQGMVSADNINNRAKYRKNWLADAFRQVEFCRSMIKNNVDYKP